MATTKIPALEEIKKALAPALEEGGASKAIVFGSYARGDADEYSDLDLVVVVKTSKSFFQRLEDFPNLRKKCPVGAMDVLFYTPQEFKTMAQGGNPLILRVLEEGKTIYEA